MKHQRRRWCCVGLDRNKQNKPINKQTTRKFQRTHSQVLRWEVYTGAISLLHLGLTTVIWKSLLSGRQPAATLIAQKVCFMYTSLNHLNLKLAHVCCTEHEKSDGDSLTLHNLPAYVHVKKKALNGRNREGS